MSEFAQTDLPDRIRNSGLPLESTFIGGSSVMEMLGIRRAHDIDAVVDSDTYRQLRELHNFEERTEPNDGFRHLVSGDLDVSTTWNGKTTDELRKGGYTHDGINFVGLPEIYQHKESRGFPKDGPDLELIKQRLYGNGPLPKEMLGDDLQFVQGLVPEHLRGHAAVHVAANGLHIVRTVFGHEGETVRNYAGSVEQSPVPATYHAWEHSALGAKDGQESMDRGEAAWQQQGKPGQRYTDNERLAALAFTSHDAILGHGRRSANPDAHDERQAAELVARQLEGAGVTDEQLIEGSYQTVIVTTFNEQRKAQDIDPTRGHLLEQEHGAAMDMSAMRRPDGPLSTIRLAIEDLGRLGAGYDRPLSKLVDQLNADLPDGTPPIRINTTEQGLELIEQHPDFPAVKQTPDGPQHMTLREALSVHVGGSGWFYNNYRFPESWQAGDPAMQFQNAQVMEGWSAGIKNGEIPPTQLPAMGMQHIAEHQAGGTTAKDSSAARPESAAPSDATDPILRALRDLRGTME